MEVARVGRVEQGQRALAVQEQPQPNLAQVMPSALVVASERQFTFRLGRHVGVVISGIKQKAVRGLVVLGPESLQELFADLFDLLG